MTDEPEEIADGAWLVEERSGDRWLPAVYHGPKPVEKRTGGPRRVFQYPPVLVPRYMLDKPLAELALDLRPRAEPDLGDAI